MVFWQLAQLAAAKQIRPAVADVTSAAGEPDHSIAVSVVIGGDRPRLLAYRAVSLGDRLGQHGDSSAADAGDSSNGSRVSMAAALARRRPVPVRRR